MESPNDSTAKYYDVVYDYDFSEKITKQELKFIISQINEGAILDVGCGTGRHLIPLLQMGRSVTGIDNSSKMLEELEIKLNKHKISATILCEDIRSLDTSKELFTKEKFGGAICFFNAFTEIAKSPEEALKVLKSLHSILLEGGKLIIEVSNPSSFDPNTFESISTSKKDGVDYDLFYKMISYDQENHISTAHEKITVRKNNEVISMVETKIVQKWWTKQELQEYCEKIGFKKIEFYGGNLLPFVEPSEEIVLVATK